MSRLVVLALLLMAGGGILTCDDSDEGMSPTLPGGWENVTSPVSTDLYDVVWNGSEFRAVGLDGKTVFSADGLNWAADSIRTDSLGSVHNLTAIEWSATPSVYVAVGAANTIVTSAEGIDWIPRPSPYPDHHDFSDVVWFEDRFFAIGELGMVASTNGQEWTIVLGDKTPLRTAAFGPALAASDTLLVMVAGGAIRSSPDGIDWTLRYFSDSATLFHEVEWWPARRLWVAVGHLGLVMTSPDAITWTRVATGSGEISSFMDVLAVDATCYLVGTSNGPGLVAWSGDGVQWEHVEPVPDHWLRAMAASDDRLVLVGYEGTILVKPRR